MTRLLAVDPGLRCCGAALFKDGALVACDWVRGQNTGQDYARACASMARRVTEWSGPVSAVAAEWPQVYAQGKRGGDPNDLLPLAGVLGAVAAEIAGAEFRCYLPRQWKGTLPKRTDEERVMFKARVLARLSDEELRATRAVSAAGHAWQHNVWDAVGIGLHHLGRFGAARVFPR